MKKLLGYITSQTVNYMYPALYISYISLGICKGWHAHNGVSYATGIFTKGLHYATAHQLFEWQGDFQEIRGTPTRTSNALGTPQYRNCPYVVFSIALPT